MRLRLTECLEAYNKENDTLTLRGLAMMLYADKDTIDQTKINRISALNTGRAEATITELTELSHILQCECTDLIE